MLQSQTRGLRQAGASEGRASVFRKTDLQPRGFLGASWGPWRASMPPPAQGQPTVTMLTSISGTRCPGHRLLRESRVQ